VPSRTLLDHVTSRWGLILIALSDRTMRLSEIRRLAAPLG
jgi:DNA-binding HxlR family transcriptional regulator